MQGTEFLRGHSIQRPLYSRDGRHKLSSNTNIQISSSSEFLGQISKPPLCTAIDPTNSEPHFSDLRCWQGFTEEHSKMPRSERTERKKDRWTGFYLPSHSQLRLIHPHNPLRYCRRRYCRCRSRRRQIST